MTVDLLCGGLFSTTGYTIDVLQRWCRAKLDFKSSRSMFIRKNCLENEKAFVGKGIQSIERLCRRSSTVIYSPAHRAQRTHQQSEHTMCLGINTATKWWWHLWNISFLFRARTYHTLSTSSHPFLVHLLLLCFSSFRTPHGFTPCGGNDNLTAPLWQRGGRRSMWVVWGLGWTSVMSCQMDLADWSGLTAPALTHLHWLSDCTAGFLIKQSLQ